MVARVFIRILQNIFWGRPINFFSQSPKFVFWTSYAFPLRFDKIRKIHSLVDFRSFLSIIALASTL